MIGNGKLLIAARLGTKNFGRCRIITKKIQLPQDLSSKNFNHLAYINGNPMVIKFIFGHHM